MSCWSTLKDFVFNNIAMTISNLHYNKLLTYATDPKYVKKIANKTFYLNYNKLLTNTTGCQISNILHSKMKCWMLRY